MFLLKVYRHYGAGYLYIFDANKKIWRVKKGKSSFFKPLTKIVSNAKMIKSPD